VSQAVDRTQFDPDVVRQLGRIDIIARVIVSGVRRGLHRSRRRGFSSEFSDFNPYTPGDDLRLLDWRLYARTDRLFVKRFEAETNVELMLLLDASASMAWRWQDTISKLEYAANLLAAFACLHMRQQDQVGLLVHDATSLHHLPPRCRRAQLEAIFSALDELSPGNASTFPILVDSLARLRRHRGIVIACSDLEEEEDSLRAALRELAGTGNEIILFHLLDEAETTLPFEDATHLRDSETGATIPVSVQQFRDQYAESLQRFRQSWQDECEQCGILYMPVHTAMNYVDVIIEMVEKRNI